MYDAKQLLLPAGAEMFFNFLLQFYPESYRKRFGQEMFLVLNDTYQEEVEKKGRVGFGFWLSQIGDITQSILGQHIDEIYNKGMKKYLQQTLHINKYNVIGGIFLLPVFTVFLIDLIARIVQGDLVHYNRPVYALLSHTPLYWTPVLFTWIVVFPLLAIGFNFIPLIKILIKKNNNIKSWQFLRQNLVSILLFGFGAFFILLVKFHDFGPCMLHGLARLGFEHFTHIVAVCKNA